jgi:hypothetical protein
MYKIKITEQHLLRYKHLAKHSKNIQVYNRIGKNQNRYTLLYVEPNTLIWGKWKMPLFTASRRTKHNKSNGIVFGSPIPNQK